MTVVKSYGDEPVRRRPTLPSTAAPSPATVVASTAPASDVPVVLTVGASVTSDASATLSTNEFGIVPASDRNCSDPGTVYHVDPADLFRATPQPIAPVGTVRPPGSVIVAFCAVNACAPDSVPNGVRPWMCAASVPSRMPVIQ